MKEAKLVQGDILFCNSLERKFGLSQLFRRKNLGQIVLIVTPTPQNLEEAVGDVPALTGEGGYTIPRLGAFPLPHQSRSRKGLELVKYWK